MYLRGKRVLKKSLDGIYFSSCICIMHIKLVFITVALLCLEQQPRKQCIIAVQSPTCRESICVNSACLLFCFVQMFNVE